MKGIVYILIFGLIGFLFYNFAIKEESPEEKMSKAQTTGRGVIKFWTDQAVIDNSSFMKSVCKKGAVGQSVNALEAMHEVEERRGGQYDKCLLRSMGGGGALKAVFAGDDSLSPLQMTISAEEIDGKWWVTRISVD